MRLTLDEVYHQGLEALRERLGQAGMIRFLQQFKTGSDDYSIDRRQWVDNTTLERIQELSNKKRPKDKSK